MEARIRLLFPENLFFFLFGMIGYFLFTVVDTLIKLTGNLEPTQVPLMSGIFIALLVCVFEREKVSLPKINRLWFYFFGYILSNGLNVVCLYYVFWNIPMIEAYPILLLMPIGLSILSAITLKYSLSVLDLVLLGMGLMGSLFIIEPNYNTFTVAHLVAFVAMFLAILRAYFNKLIGTQLQSSLMMYGSQFFFVIFTIVFYGLPNFSEYRFDAEAMTAIFFVSVFAVIAMRMMIYAYKFGDPKIVSSAVFSQVVFGALISSIIFGDVIVAYDIIGIILTLSTGFIMSVKK